MTARRFRRRIWWALLWVGLGQLPWLWLAWRAEPEAMPALTHPVRYGLEPLAHDPREMDDEPSLDDDMTVRYRTWPHPRAWEAPR